MTSEQKGDIDRGIIMAVVSFKIIAHDAAPKARCASVLLRLGENNRNTHWTAARKPLRFRLIDFGWRRDD
jgi:hypothetical protein